MATFRVHKTDNYTTMSNHHLRNKALSLSAKGLLSVILSLPPDWKYSVRGLASISKEGERAIKTALDELKEHGYLVVKRIEPHEGNNRVSYEYDVYEVPFSEQNSAKPQVAEACGCEGVHGEGVQGEGVHGDGQLNTKEVSTEGLSTEEQKKEERESSLKKIVAYLNAKTGSRYRTSSQSTRELVLARLNEGFTVDDFIDVIDFKVDRWGKDRKMAEYLRPSTLFAPSHFEEYLNESRRANPTPVTFDTSEWQYEYRGDDYGAA